MAKKQTHEERVLWEFVQSRYQKIREYEDESWKASPEKLPELLTSWKHVAKKLKTPISLFEGYPETLITQQWRETLEKRFEENGRTKSLEEQRELRSLLDDILSIMYYEDWDLYEEFREASPVTFEIDRQPYWIDDDIYQERKRKEDKWYDPDDELDEPTWLSEKAIWAVGASQYEWTKTGSVHCVDMDTFYLLGWKLSGEAEQVYEIPKLSMEELAKVLKAFAWYQFETYQFTQFAIFTDQFDDERNLFVEFIFEMEKSGYLTQKDDWKRILVGLASTIEYLFETDYFEWTERLRWSDIPEQVKAFLVQMIDTRHFNDKELLVHEDRFLSTYFNIPIDDRYHVWYWIGNLIQEAVEEED